MPSSRLSFQMSILCATSSQLVVGIDRDPTIRTLRAWAILYTPQPLAQLLLC